MRSPYEGIKLYASNVRQRMLFTPLLQQGWKVKLGRHMGRSASPLSSRE
jgi:hypothetical protein